MIGSARGLARVSRIQWRTASSSTRSHRPSSAKKTTSAKQPLPQAKAAGVAKLPKARSTQKPYQIPQKPRAQSDGETSQQTLTSIWRRSWLPLSGAAVLAGFLGFYIAGTLTATLRDSKPCACDNNAVPTGRPPALSGDNAEQFDKELDLGEWWMGITKLRKRIAAQAKGQVLELAMGTGRNLEYYDWEAVDGKVRGRGITTFTGLDISVDMLDVARKRLVKTVPPMASSEPVVKASTMADHTGGHLSYLNDRLRLVNSDAHHKLPSPPSSPSAKYDTVIQTFGLCSVNDPVAVLTNLATAVKPETGRIILLEHGKGWYGIVNGLLDRNAGKHFQKYGCWWNRDIQEVVEKAASATPGLEIVKIERPNLLQMGTMLWIELKVIGTSEPLGSK